MKVMVFYTASSQVVLDAYAIESRPVFGNNVVIIGFALIILSNAGIITKDNTIWGLSFLTSIWISRDNTHYIYL